MKLSITCQNCGKLLASIEKDEDFNSSDIDMYKQSVSCSTLQSDGTTLDGQDSIQVTKTVK
jgi:hypothetical protein